MDPEPRLVKSAMKVTPLDKPMEDHSMQPAPQGSTLTTGKGAHISGANGAARGTQGKQFVLLLMLIIYLKRKHWSALKIASISFLRRFWQLYFF